ncbi:MAG: 16S rRNA processing protein RimM [Bdellovibrionales bacterium]|nr:16S rRNA processing protein RimM [Bdellovibrionales bacterium]
MSSRSSSSHTPLFFTGYHCVGFIKSAHGIRGELFLGLFAGQADWESLSLSLLLPGSSELKDFELTSLKPHKDGMIVRLKGVDTRNEAELLRKSQVYIPEAALESEPGHPIFLAQIQGFELTDPAGAVLGRIEGFSSNGPQDLLQVRVSGRIALVPFIDEFIVDIDFDKKQVRMDLPPGLLNEEE